MQNTNSRSVRIGLAGGICVGKTLATETLLSSGATIIKIDDIVHELLRSPNPAYDAVVNLYGDGILLAPGGKIVRRRLWTLVFASAEARATFDATFYPYVFARLDERMAAAPQSAPIVVEAALLFEWKLADRFDEVWVIVTDDKVQLDRYMQRSGFDQERAAANIALQWPQQKKAALATRVISNTGDKELLARQVKDCFAAAQASYESSIPAQIQSAERG